MSDEEPDEFKLIKALFEDLKKQLLRKFSRGCNNAPNGWEPIFRNTAIARDLDT